MATGQLSNAEIADALKRARELATSNSSTDSVKRPFADSDSYNGNPPKRLNNHDMSAGNPITALGNAPFNTVSGMEPIVIEQYQVPDNCVGLIIGRGGESITNIQNETGCRIQMSQSYTDPTGKQMRGCTLTGTKNSIEKAKRALESIIEKAGGTLPPSKPAGVMTSPTSAVAPLANMSFVPGGGKMITVEMQIPGTKCGLIIGKGGETIKQLQERANVKMVMIQENNQVTAGYKPLRIIGEPDKVEHAKRLIEDVMNSKDDKPPGGGNTSAFLNEYGSINIKPGSSMGEVIVPRSAVGVIIGKNGETIKKLTTESGAKIQFKQEDYNAPERTALIVGSADQIQKATAMITELVNRALANDSQGGAGGGGGSFMSRMGGGQNSDASDVFYMHVPANKTGLVIGKGGETIKQISAESGARVELSRDPAPSDTEKVFVVKGTPYQIHHAQHLIRIKVGDIPQGTPVPPFSGSIAAVANEQQFSYSNFSQPAAATPADPNAAWAAYYAQYYQPTQANHFGGATYQNAASSVTAAPQAQAAAQPASSTSSAPTINPQTGQPDYSAQWAEYYRSLGMHEQAAMIEQQARANQAAAAAVAQPAQSVAGGAGAQNFGAYGQQQPAGYGYGQSAPAASGYQYAPHQY